MHVVFVDQHGQERRFLPWGQQCVSCEQNFPHVVERVEGTPDLLGGPLWHNEPAESPEQIVRLLKEADTLAAKG